MFCARNKHKSSVQKFGRRCLVACRRKQALDCSKYLFLTFLGEEAWYVRSNETAFMPAAWVWVRRLRGLFAVVCIVFDCGGVTGCCVMGHGSRRFLKAHYSPSILPFSLRLNLET